MLAPGVAWHYHKFSPETWTRILKTALRDEVGCSSGQRMIIRRYGTACPFVAENGHFSRQFALPASSALNRGEMP
jgi:hypothetical protein